jgi:hypothetical protein
MMQALADKNEREFSKCAIGHRRSFPVLGSSHCYWRSLQTPPPQEEVSADSVVAASEVLAESEPVASRERAPWPPWAAFGLQLLVGPAGVVQDARVGAEAGEAAAGAGVGQLQLGSRPVSPWLGPLGATMGMEATVAMAMATTATATGTPAMAMVLTGLTVTVGDYGLAPRSPSRMAGFIFFPSDMSVSDQIDLNQQYDETGERHGNGEEIAEGRAKRKAKGEGR